MVETKRILLRRRSPEEVHAYFVRKIVKYETAMKKALKLLEYYEERSDWENEYEAYWALRKGLEESDVPIQKPHEEQGS